MSYTILSPAKQRLNHYLELTKLK